jgi:hypothetical protein
MRSMILDLPYTGNVLTRPSVPFEGYKLSHIQAVEEERIQLLRAKILWRNFHFTLSLHPFILESLNTLFNPQALPSLMENLIVSFI